MTTKPANPSPNSSATKRAARTEAFRAKNAKRRALRAQMRSSMSQGEYRYWRHLMRVIRFYPSKTQKEFFETGRIESHSQPPTGRSPQRAPR